MEVHQIHKWIQLINRKQREIHVGKVCYNCVFSGKRKEKTVIVLLDVMPQNGFITLEKSLEEVELLDILKLYKKLNNS